MKNLSPFCPVFLILFTGCAAIIEEQNAVMESWKGAHISETIREWGPPKNIVPDGQGGKIYIWSEYKSVNLSPAKTETKGTITKTYGGYQYKEKTTHKRPVDYDYVKAHMFYVNRSGTIYYWRIEGQDDEQALLFLLGLSLVALLLSAVLQSRY